MAKIKIALPKQMMQSLNACFYDVFTFMEATNDHERLLYENMGEVWNRIASALRNPEQKKYTLTLSGAEALAWMQFFRLVPLAKGSLEAETVRRVIADIDKISKQPKQLTDGIHDL